MRHRQRTLVFECSCFSHKEAQKFLATKRQKSTKAGSTKKRKKMTWRDETRRKLAQRALERQLAYQQRKAEHVRGREEEVIAAMTRSSRRVRDLLETFQPIRPDARVIEVGSGAHGLIFYFGSPHGIGVDPLAVSYGSLFPRWQRCAQTVAAVGESLPFADRSFDVVLCDNVVDHAESPERIVSELVRILVPGGLLYFTVNVHHRGVRGRCRRAFELESGWGSV